MARRRGRRHGAAGARRRPARRPLLALGRRRRHVRRRALAAARAQAQARGRRLGAAQTVARDAARRGPAAHARARAAACAVVAHAQRHDGARAGRALQAAPRRAREPAAARRRARAQALRQGTRLRVLDAAVLHVGTQHVQLPAQLQAAAARPRGALERVRRAGAGDAAAERHGHSLSRDRVAHGLGGLRHALAVARDAIHPDRDAARPRRLRRDHDHGLRDRLRRSRGRAARCLPRCARPHVHVSVVPDPGHLPGHRGPRRPASQRPRAAVPLPRHGRELHGPRGRRRTAHRVALAHDQQARRRLRRRGLGLYRRRRAPSVAATRRHHTAGQWRVSDPSRAVRRRTRANGLPLALHSTLSVPRRRRPWGAATLFPGLEASPTHERAHLPRPAADGAGRRVLKLHFDQWAR